MQFIFGLQVGLWMLLWLTAFSWVKMMFPDSTPGKVLGSIC